MLQAPISSIADDYRALRTRLQPYELTFKTLLVTSAVPSEGKSTTTANLGIALAHLGHQVLLVDTDLRRPTLHQHFDVQQDRGLSNILVDGVDWRQVIQNTAIENLKILPTGDISHNPSDLLSLVEMKELIQHLSHHFDIVIFDAPIALSVNDVEIIAPIMDRVLLIHYPRKCDKQSVIEVRKLLAKIDAKITGIVFNNVSEKEQKYFYDQKQFRYEYKKINRK